MTKRNLYCSSIAVVFPRSLHPTSQLQAGRLPVDTSQPMTMAEGERTSAWPAAVLVLGNLRNYPPAPMPFFATSWRRPPKVEFPRAHSAPFYF